MMSVSERCESLSDCDSVKGVSLYHNLNVITDRILDRCFWVLVMGCSFLMVNWGVRRGDGIVILKLGLFIRWDLMVFIWINEMNVYFFLISGILKVLVENLFVKQSFWILRAFKQNCIECFFQGIIQFDLKWRCNKWIRVERGKSEQNIVILNPNKETTKYHSNCKLLLLFLVVVSIEWMSNTIICCQMEHFVSFIWLRLNKSQTFYCSIPIKLISSRVFTRLNQ